MLTSAIPFRPSSIGTARLPPTMAFRLMAVARSGVLIISFCIEPVSGLISAPAAEITVISITDKSPEVVTASAPAQRAVVSRSPRPMRFRPRRFVILWLSGPHRPASVITRNAAPIIRSLMPQRTYSF